MRIAWMAAMTLLHMGFWQAPVPAPPMKMGLWEQTTVVNMKMTGAKAPPGMPQNQTVKTLSCFTLESWTALMGNSNKSCAFSIPTVAGSHLSMDITCAAPMAMKMHVDGDFSTPETGHGTVHGEMNSPQMNMVSDSVFDMHFVSVSCGAVAPGKTQIVH